MSITSLRYPRTRCFASRRPVDDDDDDDRDSLKPQTLKSQQTEATLPALHGGQNKE